MATLNGTGCSRVWRGVFLVLAVVGVTRQSAILIEGWSSLAGNLKLTNGSSSYSGEGVVSARVDEEWRMICGSNWDLDAADAVCRHLGYSQGAAAARAVMAPSVVGDLSVAEPVVVEVVSCGGGSGGDDEDQEEDWSSSDCEDDGASGAIWCSDPAEVAWVRCHPHTPFFGPLHQRQAISVADTSAPALDKPTVKPLDYGRVMIAWSSRNGVADSGGMPEKRLLVSYNIKYREVDNVAGIEDYQRQHVRFSENTRYTLSGLKEKATYEFAVEAVGADEHGEDIVWPITSAVIATMLCGAPSPVRNMSVAIREDNTLAVTWALPLRPDCPPSSYVVGYSTRNLDQCEDYVKLGLDSSSAPVITEDTALTISGLLPHSTYTVHVTARSDRGDSAKQRETVTTGEAVPSGVPANIASRYTGESELHITWDQIPCGGRCGEVNGYTYLLLDLTTDTVTHSGHTSRRGVELTGPRAVRRYKFMVAGVTKMGRGPYGVFSVDAKPKLQEICGRTTQSDSLTSNEMVQKIVSGTTAYKGSAPWLAQLWYVQRGTLFCHGSILDERWIITAAHCIKARNSTKDDIVVKLGDFDKLLPEEEEQAYRVEEIVVHRRFNAKTFDSDVALIKVSRPIHFNEYIRPVCFLTKKLSKEMLAVERLGVVTGWGKLTSDGDEYPRYPKRVELPVKHQRTCKESTRWDVTHNMFCAGYVREGMGDSCEGDSGSPFVVRHGNGRWYVLGVVSWGEGCDRHDKFGFYVRLYKFVSWIRQQTGYEPVTSYL